MRIAPNEYSIDDPEAVRTIYGLATNFTKVGGQDAILSKLSQEQ